MNYNQYTAFFSCFTFHKHYKWLSPLNRSPRELVIAGSYLILFRLFESHKHCQGLYNQIEANELITLCYVQYQYNLYTSVHSRHS